MSFMQSLLIIFFLETIQERKTKLRKQVRNVSMPNLVSSNDLTIVDLREKEILFLSLGFVIGLMIIVRFGYLPIMRRETNLIFLLVFIMRKEIQPYLFS